MREIFASAKFRGVATKAFRRNFRGSKFHTSAPVKPHLQSANHALHKAIHRSFHGSYFHGSRSTRENHESLHYAKIPVIQ